MIKDVHVRTYVYKTKNFEDLILQGGAEKILILLSIVISVKHPVHWYYIIFLIIWILYKQPYICAFLNKSKPIEISKKIFLPLLMKLIFFFHV